MCSTWKKYFLSWAVHTDSKAQKSKYTLENETKPQLMIFALDQTYHKLKGKKLQEKLQKVESEEKLIIADQEAAALVCCLQGEKEKTEQ